ncbi:MAG: hypothetical protein ACRECV_01645 [Xanthobacteraceae bacterium]
MFIGRDHWLTPLGGRIAAAIRRRTGRHDVAAAIRRFEALPVRALAGVLFAAATLAGCALNDGVGALMVDPGRYEGYNCKGLVGQWNGLIAREKKLRNLIDKADETSSGVVIGALAYRGDYQTVLEQKRVLQRTAVEKSCQVPPPPPAFTSDKVIH